MSGSIGTFLLMDCRRRGRRIKPCGNFSIPGHIEYIVQGTKAQSLVGPDPPGRVFEPPKIPLKPYVRASDTGRLPARTSGSRGSPGQGVSARTLSHGKAVPGTRREVSVLPHLFLLHPRVLRNAPTSHGPLPLIEAYPEVPSIPRGWLRPGARRQAGNCVALVIYVQETIPAQCLLPATPSP